MALPPTSSSSNISTPGMAGRKGRGLGGERGCRPTLSSPLCETFHKQYPRHCQDDLKGASPTILLKSFPEVVFIIGLANPSDTAGLVWTAAGFQVGALPCREHTAALCLLWEWALVGPTVPIHRPSLPLADVSIEDVLNVLHYEVYSNCREEWGTTHVGFPG